MINSACFPLGNIYKCVSGNKTNKLTILLTNIVSTFSMEGS